MSSDSTTTLTTEIRIFTNMIAKHVSRAFEQRLSTRYPGVSALQFGIVRLVGGSESTISELSAKMMLAPATLVPAVDKLEKEGFLVRGRDPSDRRRNPLHLTMKGTQLLDDIAFVSPDDPLYKAVDTIGKEQAEELSELLKQLVRSLFPGQDLVSEALMNFDLAEAVGEPRAAGK